MTTLSVRPQLTEPEPESVAIDAIPVHDAGWALPPEGTDPRVVAWVEKMAHLTTPDTVVWCDGSRREHDELLRLMVSRGTLTRLNAEHRPYSFLARSHPDDVARVE